MNIFSSHMSDFKQCRYTNIYLDLFILQLPTLKAVNDITVMLSRKVSQASHSTLGNNYK